MRIFSVCPFEVTSCSISSRVPSCRSAWLKQAADEVPSDGAGAGGFGAGGFGAGGLGAGGFGAGVEGDGAGDDGSELPLPPPHPASIAMLIAAETHSSERRPDAFPLPASVHRGAAASGRIGVGAGGTARMDGEDGRDMLDNSRKEGMRRRTSAPASGTGSSGERCAWSNPRVRSSQARNIFCKRLVPSTNDSRTVASCRQCLAGSAGDAVAPGEIAGGKDADDRKQGHDAGHGGNPVG